MGGNVFPGKNRRYSRDEYLALVDELAFTFDIISKDGMYNVAPALNDKESFGDMDVVLVPYFPFSVENLDVYFHTPYIKNNGGTWSLIYKEFQIDLITSNEAEYEFHKNYIGVADRGNFVGKIAHMLGLKFGHDGLWLPVRSSDSHKLGDILLTRDPKVAEAFLDIKQLEKADTFQDVFDNIAASKFFNPSVFLLENNNAVARIRDRKRPHYHQFLHFCSKLEPKEWFPRVKDKSIYFDMIFEAFPDAKDEFEDLWNEKHITDTVREKFNGTLVAEWTGLENKELGALMIMLNKAISRYDLYKMSHYEIKWWVTNFYNQRVL